MGQCFGTAPPPCGPSGVANVCTCGKWLGHDQRLPHEPPVVARQTDPLTSHEAAASVGTDMPRVRAGQDYIRRLLKLFGPLTDVDIAYVYGNAVAVNKDAPRMSPSGLRTRRAELVALGLVRDSGRRRLLPTGRKAIVWEAI